MSRQNKKAKKSDKKDVLWTQKRSQVVYTKEGRKYVPLGYKLFPGDYYPLDGDFIHVSVDNCVMTRNIEPAWAEVEAALMVAEEAMVRAMIKKDKFSPNCVPLTRKECKLVDRLRKLMNEDRIVMTRPSMREVVDAGIKELRKYLKK